MGSVVVVDPLQITDGTASGNTAVKAASTAPVATDPALVVAISPNTPILPVSGTVTANQGTANTLANKWPVQVTDGTNTMPTADTAARAQFHKVTDGTNTANVKAASTAAVATDPALVVAVSPNNTVATTQSGTWTNTVTQATAANLNATVKVTDGTNIAAVKPANTAPLATDPALVVTMSPSANTTVTESDQLFSSSYPDPSSRLVGTSSPSIDAFGNLETRGPVLTDEGSFRDDYSGSAITTAITGTLGFTSGGTDVTGSGTTFTTQLQSGDYIKKTSDSETLYVQVSSVNSDTDLTLASAYGGTTASGVTAVSSNWITSTPAGGSITVASSVVSLAPGTTSGNIVSLTRHGDFLPFVLQFYGNISQRIANQTTTVGFRDANGNAQASVVFDGTVNTTVKLRTANSSAATDTTDTVCTLPTGNTSTNHLYELDILQDRVVLVIDGSEVGVSQIHLPDPYGVMNIVAEVKNAATVTATTLALDLLFFENLDNLQTSNIFVGNPNPVQLYGKTTSGLLVAATFDTNGNLQTVSNAASGGAISYGDVTLAAVTTSPVERTTYTEQTTNFTGSIVSSSANDTSAGTGARQITIVYIDQTGATQTTTVYTLNGTTAVNLSATGMCFIESMEVTSVGSTGSNVGTISLFTGTGGTGTLVGTIGATDNKTFWAHHYTLTGKTCRITGSTAGSTSTTVGAGSSYVVKAKVLGVSTAPEFQVADTLTLYGQSSQTARPYTSSIPIATGPARLRMYVTTLSGTSQTYRGAFDFFDS